MAGTKTTPKAKAKTKPAVRPARKKPAAAPKTERQRLAPPKTEPLSSEAKAEPAARPRPAPPSRPPGRQLAITWVRSAIGRPGPHKLVVKGLGFRKLNQTVLRPDTPAIRGMIAKISHLVKFEVRGSGA